MLGFLSKEQDPKATVKKEDIFFVSVPSNFSLEEIEIDIQPKALTFARTLNIEKVFLHIGGNIIKYDFKISL